MKTLWRQESGLMRFLARLTDLVILNLVFLISCLPLVTIGAATSSLLFVTMQIVRQEDNGLVKAYLRSFRLNFRQSSLWFLLIGTGVGLLVIDGRFMLLTSGFLKVATGMAMVIVGLLLAILTIYTFPYVSRYEVSFKRSGLNSLYLGLRFPFSTGMLVLFNSAIVISTMSSAVGMITGLYFFTFGGISLLALLNSWVIQRVFTRHELLAKRAS